MICSSKWSIVMRASPGVISQGRGLSQALISGALVCRTGPATEETPLRICGMKEWTVWLLGTCCQCLTHVPSAEITCRQFPVSWGPTLSIHRGYSLSMLSPPVGSQKCPSRNLQQGGQGTRAPQLETFKAYPLEDPQWDSAPVGHSDHPCLDRQFISLLFSLCYFPTPSPSLPGSCPR